MKSFYVLIVMLVFNFIAFGQSNFNIGFKKGFENGYCYSNNQSGYYCNPPVPPLPPLPQISESSNSYQDGYNRGFLYGQSQRRNDDNNSSSNASSNPPKFNPYVSQIPVDAMTRVGVTKQQKYDTRTNWVQERIYKLTDLITSLFTQQNLPGIAIESTRNIYIIKIRDYVGSIYGADYTNDYQFNNIVDGFQSVENEIYRGYNSCVESENKRNLERKAKLALKTQNESNVSNSSTFNSYINKEIGTYSCYIYLFKYNKDDKSYRSEDPFNGFLKIKSSNCIDFKGNSDEWKSRCLINQKIDSNDFYKYTYETDYGDVIVRKDTNEFVFYDETKSCFYKYVIENKVD